MRLPAIPLADTQLASLARRQIPLLPLWLAGVGSQVWFAATGAYDDGMVSRALLDGWVVLAALPPDSNYVRGKDIATETGISNMRVSRSLYTLALLRIIEHDSPTGRYRLARWHP
jgi:hypothetical protein